MTVISISVEESAEQISLGIPRYITMTTNISATIFYTLDGTTPTLFSNIYIGPISLPRDRLSLTLSAFANDGVNSSSIITENYISNFVSSNTRLPHSSTSASVGENIQGLYPFGNNNTDESIQFLNPADSGITVNNTELPSTSTGWDGAGNPNAYTNELYNNENYSIIYSTKNSIGETSNLIGTLPARVTVTQEVPPAESTEQFRSTFDPRAYVIFQDLTKEDPNNPAQINRQSFTLSSENSRDNNAYFTTGLDAPPVSGSFLRQHYNPRTNMMTYYYLDTWTNKWVISTQPYVNNSSFDGNMSGPSNSGRSRGSRYVFEWQNFPRRVLF